MMEYILYFGLIFISALIWALLEIQIEGAHGWAAKLPTWRFKVYVKYIWEREITGYHVYLMSFIALLLHSVFIYVQWSLKLELKIIAFFILLGVIEDFLWFVLNPAFGLKRFNKIHVPWHSMWFLKIPTFYWVFLPLGIFIYSISLTL